MMPRRLSADEQADLKVAKHLREWLNRRGSTLVASVAGAMQGDPWEIWPASRRFGRPAVTAAALTTLPPGACCRWGMASVFAHDSGQPSLKFSVALQSLIGDPCGRCLTGMLELADLQVHAGLSDAMRRRVAARTARRAVVASVRASAPYLHELGTCGECPTWREEARVAYVTGAALTPLRPHRAKPAPTGWAGVPGSTGRAGLLASAVRAPVKQPKYVHELVGGKQTCNCDTCRAKRSRLAKARPR